MFRNGKIDKNNEFIKQLNNKTGENNIKKQKENKEVIVKSGGTVSLNINVKRVDLNILIKYLNY